MKGRETVNLGLAGVGGQGIMLAGRIVARAAQLAGHEVAASEVHGMAQRGGSVFTTVRYGGEVSSPMIPEGEADILVAFERLEALRYLDRLRPEGVALVNDQRLPPPIESLKLAPYPEDPEEIVSRHAATVLVVPGLDIATELGNPKLTSAVLLGALSTLLDLPETAWRRALRELVPQETVALNRRAFQAGVAWASRRAPVKPE